MARCSSLAWRDGRYYVQVRFASKISPLVGQPLYRALVTDQRISECLGWIQRMNDSTDYTSLFQKNVAEL